MTRTACIVLILLSVFGCDPGPPEELQPTQTADPVATSAASSPSQVYTSRYDNPRDPGTSPSSPLGHAITLTGIDLAHETISFNDPANNLANGIGVHRRRVVSDFATYQISDSWISVSIDDRTATILGAVVCRSSLNEVTVPDVRIQLSDVPDYSQHAGRLWQNYCAPTAMANAITYMFETHPVLAMQSRQLKTDDQITSLIAGEASPPPRSGSLAALMKSDAEAGTSALTVASGTQAYLGLQTSPNVVTWQVRYVTYGQDVSDGFSEVLAGPDEFFKQVITDLAAGCGIVLTIFWGTPDENQSDGSLASTEPQSSANLSDSQSDPDRSESEMTASNSEAAFAGTENASVAQGASAGPAQPRLRTPSVRLFRRICGCDYVPPRLEPLWNRNNKAG